MRCECSSWRRVNKMSLHSILVHAPSMLIKTNFFSTLQCSLITSKRLSRQVLSASTFTETYRTSRRFSRLVKVEFLPFMNSSHWNYCIYTLSFSSHELLTHALECWKIITLKQLSQHSWHSICTKKFPTIIFTVIQRPDISLKIQISFSRN